MLSQIQSHILEAVSRAPSAHNTQPWILSFKGDELQVGAREDRALPSIDPTHAEILHALGAVLENILLTLAHCGYEAEHTVLGGVTFKKPILSVRWKKGNPVVANDELYRMIPIRRTSRLSYEDNPVSSTLLAELRKLASPGCELFVTAEADQILAIRRLAALATVEQMKDRATVDELRQWMRFSKKDPRWHRDGLNVECMGWGSLDGVVTGAVLSPGGLKLISMLNAGGMVFGSVDSVAPKSPAICLLTTTSDDIDTRIEAGRTLQRMWLYLASKGLVTHPISAAVDIKSTRQEVMKLLGVPTSQNHVNIFRIGCSRPVARSPRLPMEEMLVGHE